MTENDLYKVCALRCPACEIKYEGEIECMQDVKVGDKVLDSCPHCGFLGDVKILAFIALLLLCTHSWGACYQNPIGGSACGCAVNWNDCSASPGCATGGIDVCQPYLGCTGDETSCYSGSMYYYGLVKSCYCSGINGYRVRCDLTWSGYCNTQAEADSASCALNPDAEGCIVERDTTLFACSDNASGNGALYRLSCKATNGVVTSCNGKTDVDVMTDGQLVRQLSGSCAQNGFNTGIIGGSSVEQDSTPPSTTAECWAILGSKCQMRDKASGNTFMCECDGDCDYAVRRVVSGECQNPYPPPSGDSLTFPESSGSEGGSSGSEGGSSGSEGGSSGSEGGSSSSDYEIDYTEVLEQIRGNTQYTGTQVERLNEKATTANEYLRQIAEKEFDPTINVNVDARDTINIEVNGDTARAPAEILGLLSGAFDGSQNPEDTAGFGAQESTILSRIDSLIADTLPRMSGDSLQSAVDGARSAFFVFRDSMENGAFSDSVEKWEEMLLDNGVISGSGSDNCPAVLERTWRIDLYGSAGFTFGPLGKYLCATLPAVGVTFWALCRVIIRAAVSIACMIWIFKAALGIDGSGGNDED